jgi:hypothetical protein
VERLDLTALRPWLRTTWDVNRAFTSASVALLLALLAMGTSAGAFGGPAAAAEGPPNAGTPNEVVAPGPSGDEPSPGPSGDLPSDGPSGGLPSPGASASP